jgi:8-oxo-dGTP diphosphatase
LAERFAYVIAFRGDAFLMVRHKRRKWEMPGGRILEGESYEDGARREFLEETGTPLTEIIGEIKIDRDEGKVFVGFAGWKTNCELSDEISEVKEFIELPKELSFPLVEYETMLAQAKSTKESFKKKKFIGRTASPLNKIKSE